MLMAVAPLRKPAPIAEPADVASPPSDQLLIAAILDGDERAAEVLYDRLRPVIDHALRRVLHGRPTDFEDLVQVTFERIITGLAESRFDGRSRLTTWAAAIAGHVAMDALRRRFREERVFTRVMPTAVTSSASAPQAAERRLEARSEIRRLHGILARMKPHLADTLVLHDVLGHELAEVAEIVGAGLSATQSRLQRARAELLRRAATSVSKRGER
jgi:RNA polymerase sigma factor (sigma-70 family)